MYSNLFLDRISDSKKFNSPVNFVDSTFAYCFGNRNLSYAFFEKEYFNAYTKFHDNFIFSCQTHSDQTFTVCTDYVTKLNMTDTYPLIFADSLITSEKNVFLCIKTADCFPIFVMDKKNKTVAAVHSGRKGTQKKIVYKTMARMAESYGLDKNQTIILIGPGICSEHYEVDEDTYFNYYGNEKKSFATGGKSYIDLKESIIEQITDFGIDTNNIFDKNICTFEDKNFFSYRRNNKKERQISFIGLLDGK